MNHKALSFVLAAAAVVTGCSIDTSQIFSDGTGAGATGGGGHTTGSSGAQGGGGTGGATGGGGAQGGGGTGGATGGGGAQGGGGTGGGTTTTGCNPGPNDDADKDGFTAAAGDCNDCDPAVNPDAIDIPGNAVDENCDGKIDEALPVCDDAVGMDDKNAYDMPHVLDLCKTSANTNDWGIISVVWTMPDGSPVPDAAAQNFHVGHGTLPDFGPNVMPRHGKKLLALSSGSARRPGDPGYQNVSGWNKGYQSPAVQGYPKESPSCNGVQSGQPVDAVGFEMLVRIPSNAHGFSYDFSFYSWDFPQFVCTQYDDFFFAMLTPPLPGKPDGHVGFDDLGNPVSLNAANFRACGCNPGPCKVGNKTYDCALGTSILAGTGFDPGMDPTPYRGSTGWLTTTVPVTPGGQISIRWGVYDSGDGIGDSTVLLDNWQWITSPNVTQDTAIAK